MAVAVSLQPSDDTAAGKCFRWQLTQTAPADPTTTRRVMLYQLILASNSEAVTPLEQVTYTGTPINIDFKEDIVQHMEGFRPSLYVSYNSADIWYTGFKLRFAELDFDLTTCADPGDPTFTETAEKRVWNTYPQFNEYPIANIDTIGFVMSYKPSGVIKMARGQRDWIYFVPGQLGADIVVKQYDNTGTLIQTNGFGYNAGLNLGYIFGFGGINTPGVSDVNNLSKMEIDITGRPSDTPIANYIVEFYDACEEQEYREVYFVEPLLTVSSVRFDEVRFEPLRKTNQAQEETLCTDTNLLGMLSGGLKTIGNTSHKRLTLRKHIEGYQKWVAFYEGFISSRYHWIAVKQNGGSIQMSKFIMDDATIEVSKDDDTSILSVSGRLHKDFQTVKQFPL